MSVLDALDANTGGERPLVGGYSRAFERFVEDEQDIEGLLAYALYKKSVRSRALDGRLEDRARRDPSDPELSVYRGAARSLLESFAQAAIIANTPQILDAAEVERLDSLHSALERHTATVASVVVERTAALKSELSHHVTARTGYWGAIVTNLAAWLFTIIITAAALIGVSQPNVGARIGDFFRQLSGSP